MTEKTFRLGQPVIYTGRLSREHAYKVPPWDVTVTWKQRCKWWQQNPCEPGEGVIVGRRTLANGYVVNGGYDEPNEWMPREYVRAYLVADNIDQKPFFVHPDQLEEWSHGRLELLAAET